jgi:RNA polymerase sigma-70 factor (ECF subfamily)
MNVIRLIERCLQRDKKAWDLFVQKYSRLIYWAIRKRLVASSFTFNQDDIDCIFQEVFVSILDGDKFLQLRETKTIASWLAIIASNKSVDFMRRKIKENQRIIPDLPESFNNVFKEELEKKDLAGLVSSAINNLSAKEKIIVSLNLIENRTHREIAAFIGMPVNTVSTIIVRAKEKLKRELNRSGFKNL